MRHRTILVVEDNPLTQRAVCDILRGEGYVVLAAGDGEGALAALASVQVDLILLDMLLPKVDGWGILVKLHAGGSQVPVVVTTGIDLTHEWAESYSCQGLLKKPVPPDALLAEVRRCLTG